MSIAEQEQQNSNSISLESQEKPKRKSKRKIKIEVKPAFTHELFKDTDLTNAIARNPEEEYRREAQRWVLTEEKELKESFKPNIESLFNNFPNFYEVTEFYDGQAKLSELACKWFNARPVLLLGDAGIGKTQFCKTLSEVLELDFKVINCATISAGWVISGLSSSWKGAKVGQIASFMRDIMTANPIIMLDEIDKLKSMKEGDPYGSLYSLLELNTSKQFVDEFLDFPLDLSRVNWIATANDLSSIPEPILSRFKIISVKPPTKDNMKIIVKNMFNNIKEDLGLQYAIKDINEDAIDYVAESCTTPREANVMLLESFGKAARTHNEVGPVVITKEHCVKFDNKAKRKVGF